MNADFLINTSDPLAVRYNDKQPLENHHAAAAFALLAKPEYNFLETLTRAQFATFRKVLHSLQPAESPEADPAHQLKTALCCCSGYSWSSTWCWPQT